MQPNLIKSVRPLTEFEKKFIPVEIMVRDMNSWEQYAEKVINFTSRYNISFSISYAPDNLVGKYTKYPSYGDFPETYSLRSYGRWWKESEAHQLEYMPQESDPLGAEDYVTLGFERAVVPRDVCIYETYNPGAVVRIWGRFTELHWKLLWEGPPQVCAEESRKFHPTIKKYNCLINEIRLEFNQSHLKYHTAIDAVLLGGYQPKRILQQHVLQNDLLNWKISEDESPEKQMTDTDPANGNCDFFARLPHEVILHIFQYLDLKSLCRCAQVNKTWYDATLDPVLYQNLSLKRYWHRINSKNLNYFKNRCLGIRKLDLSWCGSDDKFFSSTFLLFLHHCCQHLTHLSLCHCEFVNNEIVAKISQCRELTELRLRNTKPDYYAFQHLARLNKLITLDLCCTNVTDDPLMTILKANQNLTHLMLDFCENIERLDQIVETVASYNKNLRTWSSFKTTTLVSGGLHFARCTNLRELDLGWCFLFAHPGDCLEKIAANCRHLKRLIISQWRGVNDQMLLPVVTCCKDLRQLDLLGIKSITGDICERALVSLSHLKLLDISFCDSISDDQVLLWRTNYPNVTIQRSCQFLVTDYLN
nr:PREDICTED: F-box/LRR-repeat protein 4 [Tribolium castaneum]|eukprot:XP_971231.2 PREDICTED: F-box/LRR-repeat protein 4 [Tribolium castaneum]